MQSFTYIVINYVHLPAQFFIIINVWYNLRQIVFVAVLTKIHMLSMGRNQLTQITIKHSSIPIQQACNYRSLSIFRVHKFSRNNYSR